MSKENSHDSKITLKSPGLIVAAQKTKSLSPLNKDVSGEKTLIEKNKHTTKTHATVHKQSKKAKKNIKHQKEKINSYHIHPMKEFKSDSSVKSKFFSLERIIDFVKQKNSDLMRELQEQTIRTISAEEERSNLALQNRNMEELHIKLSEERANLHDRVALLGKEIEANRNTVKDLIQELNHLRYEVEHLNGSKKRLMSTIRDQENAILNEKKSKQQLESTVWNLNNSITEYCKTSPHAAHLAAKASLLTTKHKVR